MIWRPVKRVRPKGALLPETAIGATEELQLEYKRQYYRANHTRLRTRDNEYRRKNRERIRERQQIYGARFYAKFREIILQQKRIRRRRRIEAMKREIAAGKRVMFGGDW